MRSLFHRGLAGLTLAAVIAGAPLGALAQEAAAPAAPAAEAPAAPTAEAPSAGGVGAAAAPGVTAPAEAAAPAVAEAPAAPTVDKGDTTWMLISTILVLLMILPGLALFYGGLVRQKNMLSMLMQVSTVTVIGMMAWILWGYSLAFTDGGGLDKFVGGFGRLFLKDVTPSSTVATFSTGIAIPELVFIAFQMTFACITASLVLGGVAERMKFAAVVVFAVLWPILSYYPMAHMVWWWAGPDAVAAAPTDPIQSGLLWGFGALDFAGGTVVHINAGVAALVGALILGPRKGYRAEAMPPHSLTLTLVGAGLLWVGWFGFNAGSNLEANGYAALAMVNTFVATAAAGFSWVITEWVTRKRASMLGLASGLVAGLVAVTPAAGFAGPVGALILGLIVSPICVVFCSTIKNALKYDDSLDAFGIHAVGGIVGAIATGLLVNPEWGGAGVVDYTTCAADGDISTCDAAAYVLGTQVMAQIKAVLVAIAWSGVASAIVFALIKYTVGIRVSADVEEEGLDITEHGERAYHY
ncbi:ammonium transporter [Phenylobacterium sp.]|jgi:Amt family ammonium transporter|uniref:ammonium transporter n=1 Tax=Phenylobacterium sp. TaxID=1871053 RepID=UPI002E360AD6|nr:ammonium transporter [Phenylobacterium sp.]HEX2558874.1 ammonium transporter [Phenylobacterium sp.]